MAAYFFDTSALAKLYHEETGSDVVDRLIQLFPGSIFISRFGLLEIESVFAIKVRSKILDMASQRLARTRLQADIFYSRVRVGPPITERHYHSARRLVVEHGVALALRSLDAIQLAVALELRDEGLVSFFVAGDRKLCRVAEVCGFSTINLAEPGLIVL